MKRKLVITKIAEQVVTAVLENEEVVEKALRAFPEISERPLSADFGGIACGRGGVLTPENPWTDGFYLAAFSK